MSSPCSADHVIGLKCTICGTVYTPDEVEYVCPHHGHDGNLDVQYDYDCIADHLKNEGFPNKRGQWRYKPLLPVPPDVPEPPLLVGGTPLYRADHLATQIGVGVIWIKDEGRNPTASLKDRASALIVSRALVEQREIITTASTGNAAAALAGVAASVKMPTVIFVPASAPEAKITQLQVYGAHVLLVKGTYDDAFDLCLQASDAFGWYSRNTGYNPYTAEGKKTVSFELCEQLAEQPGHFRAPDTILVSVGDGNIISGVHKGLKDLRSLGLIDHIPRLFGVQAEGSAALYQAWKEGLDPVSMTPINADTVADSICSNLPRDRIKAMRAVTETNGIFLTVSDKEIVAAIPSLAQETGVFAEPAAAATYAGLSKAGMEGIFSPDEEIAVLITGNGLKDIASARHAVPTAPTIDAHLEEVTRVLGEAFTA